MLSLIQDVKQGHGQLSTPLWPDTVDKCFSIILANCLLIKYQSIFTPDDREAFSFYSESILRKHAAHFLAGRRREIRYEASDEVSARADVVEDRSR